MAHVSHKLSNAFQGALAGGGDPATSPLYVFGPFLRLIVVGGVAQVTFGASVWLVVFTVFMVSTMYRLVMRWVVDGSGGSGLSEEEFGSWAVKVNAGITFVEYTLTFLVSIAALVTFVADRYPALNDTVIGVQYRTLVAIGITIATGWVVNRGPKAAAVAFGPATLAVLALLWTMVVATIWKQGFHLPTLDFRAFGPEYLGFTLGGFARILALMTGIEIFANLVAAYSGTNAQKSRKAFGSLVIIMGTTCVTMLVVGPAILSLSDPTNEHMSVFTQTMDALLPAPLPYIGTLIGVVVLGSAAAASAQGLQNLALGLRFRQYIPATFGIRNRFDVADKPVWLEVFIVCVCYVAFGTSEETYLAIYAAGVFILLSMTGWAAAKRLVRQLREAFSAAGLATLAGTVIAAFLTTIATGIIFYERFFEGAWTYLLFLPALYAVFTYYRARLGKPLPLDEHLGRFFVGQYLLPYQRQARPADEIEFDDIVVPLDGSSFAEDAIPLAEVLAHTGRGRIELVSVVRSESDRKKPDESESEPKSAPELERYLAQLAWSLAKGGVEVHYTVRAGDVPETIDRVVRDVRADLIVMCTHGRTGVERMVARSTSHYLIKLSDQPILVVRPTEEWTSRTSRFSRLLVTLDGSESAETVLPYVRAMARTFDSEIVLVAVPESEAEQIQLEQYLNSVVQALRAQGFKAKGIVTGSGAARTILAVSREENVDLLMIATRGRGGLATLEGVGSVTERVVESTHCPVFLAPVRPRVTRAVTAVGGEDVTALSAGRGARGGQ
ncbi:MAG: universal stress protein [Gemmatimonadota bacterium]|nr:universal stress protein [Gemmatimonadota bacterium]